jgi:hypothetical protein
MELLPAQGEQRGGCPQQHKHKQADLTVHFVKDEPSLQLYTHRQVNCRDQVRWFGRQEQLRNIYVQLSVLLTVGDANTTQTLSHTAKQ